MRKIGRLLILCFLSFFVQSCIFGDCNQIVRGQIRDEITNNAIIGVKICNKDKDWNYAKSDSLGFFRISSISGGLWGCPDMDIIISKEGYKTIETTIPAGGNKTILLERIK